MYSSIAALAVSRAMFLNVFRAIAFMWSCEPPTTASIRPRQNLIQLRQELLPSVFGAGEVLRPVPREARLLHAQMRPRAGGDEREGDGGFQTQRAPGIRQRPVRLHDEDPTVDDAVPVGLRVHAKAEAVTHRRLE